MRDASRLLLFALGTFFFLTGLSGPSAVSASDALLEQSGEQTRNVSCIYSFRWRCRYPCSFAPSSVGADGSPVFCVSCGKTCNSIPLGDPGTEKITLEADAQAPRFNFNVTSDILNRLAEVGSQHLYFVTQITEWGIPMESPAYGETSVSSSHVVTESVLGKLQSSKSNTKSWDINASAFEELLISEGANVMPDHVVFYKAGVTVFEDGTAELRITSDLVDEKSGAVVGPIGNETVLGFAAASVGENGGWYTADTVTTRDRL